MMPTLTINCFSSKKLALLRCVLKMGWWGKCVHVETKNEMVKWGGKKRKNSKDEYDTLERITTTSTLSDQGLGKTRVEKQVLLTSSETLVPLLPVMET